MPVIRSTDSQQDKKSTLLGMRFTTARAQLERDLLFKFVTEAGHKCFRCGQEMTRDNFSVEHKEIWSKAKDPKFAYFDIGNIAFSHHTCNAAVTSNLTGLTRSEVRRNNWTSYRKRKGYSPEKRRLQYLRTGK